MTRKITIEVPDDTDAIGIVYLANLKSAKPSVGVKGFLDIPFDGTEMPKEIVDVGPFAVPTGRLGGAAKDAVSLVLRVIT